jgi:hypothetical protein
MTVLLYGDATKLKGRRKNLKKVLISLCLLKTHFPRLWLLTVVRRVPSRTLTSNFVCNWFNAVLSGLDGIEVSIGDNCTKTMGDYRVFQNKLQTVQSTKGKKATLQAWF